MNKEADKATCHVSTTDNRHTAETKRLAAALNLPCATPASPPGLRLMVTDEGLSLADTRPGRPGPVQVDFLTRPVLQRLGGAGARNEPLLRAIGARKGVRPSVVDATAGFGGDAAVAAASGCHVTMLETSPVVGALLRDGLRRAGEDHRLTQLLGRLQLIQGDAREYLISNGIDHPPDVVYLDPMYPDRGASAKSGKVMQHLQALLGADAELDSLVDAAFSSARRRVVIKRPRNADAAGGRPPDVSFRGSSTRFDVYLINPPR